MMNKTLVLSLLFALIASGADAFFQKASAGTSPLAKEAVAIFDEKYPFGRDPPKPSPLTTFGMPNRDFDGTLVIENAKGSVGGKRFTDITEQQAKASFAEMAKLYGDERALDMVKSLPICLAFDKTIFAASLKEWQAIFGEDESKDMVQRNPGLLAIRPEEAATANDQTMQFSYLVGYTRPFGSVLLSLLLFLLLTPAIESFTGIAIRSTFLGGL